MKSSGRSGTKKLLGFIAITVFLFVLFVSLFSMSTGMNMPGVMSGCPFMSHEEVLCSMSALDHFSAWESAFTAVAPSFALLLLAITAVALVLTVAPNLLLRQSCRIEQLSRDVRERIYTFSYRPLQELFSNGVLHPKRF